MSPPRSTPLPAPWAAAPPRTARPRPSWFARPMTPLWTTSGTPARAPTASPAGSSPSRVTSGSAAGTRSRATPRRGPRLRAARRLRVTWEYAGDISWVEVRLASAADGQTSFELEHTARVDAGRWEEFGPGDVGIGWDMTLLGLAQHPPRRRDLRSGGGRAGRPPTRAATSWPAAASGGTPPSRRGRGPRSGARSSGPHHCGLHGSAAVGGRPRLSAGTGAVDYFVMPAVRPATICFVAKRKSTMSGTVVMTRPANTAE